MSENTYLEQYLNQVIIQRYLHNWLMEGLDVFNEIAEQLKEGKVNENYNKEESR